MNFIRGCLISEILDRAYYTGESAAFSRAILLLAKKSIRTDWIHREIRIIKILKKMRCVCMHAATDGGKQLS